MALYERSLLSTGKTEQCRVNGRRSGPGTFYRRLRLASVIVTRHTPNSSGTYRHISQTSYTNLTNMSNDGSSDESEDTNQNQRHQLIPMLCQNAISHRGYCTTLSTQRIQNTPRFWPSYSGTRNYVSSNFELYSEFPLVTICWLRLLTNDLLRPSVVSYTCTTVA